MNYKVLTNDQVEEFITIGFFKLEEAIPRKNALDAQDFVWQKVAAQSGALKEDPSTWKEPMVHIRELFNEPVFQACASERLTNAIEDLVGPGRWATRNSDHNWGWWPVNFASGADRPWELVKNGWHWDNMSLQTLTMPDQGLLLLPYFSEVKSQGGGTFVAGGSHEIVARFLAGYPEGIEKPIATERCNSEHPWLAELTGKAPDQGERIERFMEQTTTDAWGTKLRVFEATASPGDVFLCHPFLYHAASQNHSGTPRFMCNRATPLTEPMNLNRADGAYSPVEISIKNALSSTPS